jgi:hypothetical protein
MSTVIDFPTKYIPAETKQAPHYRLSEEQEQCIYYARYTLQLVSDLVDAIPDKTTVQIDPRGLSALVLAVQNSLPSDKDMPFIAR